jgi:hypothetical protein
VEETRVCRKCGVEQSISEFMLRGRKNPSKHCKSCQKKQNRGYHQKWYKGHPEKARSNSKKDHGNLREQVLNKFGKVCGTCGFSDIRALQIDHVHGEGNQERKQVTNKSVFYRRVLRDSSGKYQLLCANCNWIKRHENNEVRTPSVSSD